MTAAVFYSTLTTMRARSHFWDIVKRLEIGPPELRSAIGTLFVVNHRPLAAVLDDIRAAPISYPAVYDEIYADYIISWKEQTIRNIIRVLTEASTPSATVQPIELWTAIEEHMRHKAMIHAEGATWPVPEELLSAIESLFMKNTSVTSLLHDIRNLSVCLPSLPSILESDFLDIWKDEIIKKLPVA